MSWKSEDGCGRKLVSLPRHDSREHKKNGTWVGENQRDSFSLKLILELQFTKSPASKWLRWSRAGLWLRFAAFHVLLNNQVKCKQKTEGHSPYSLFSKVCLPLNFTLRLSPLHPKRSKTFLLLSRGSVPYSLFCKVCLSLHLTPSLNPLNLKCLSKVPHILL